MMRNLIIILLLSLIVSGSTLAQGVNINAGNIYDPRVYFVNQAAMGMNRFTQVVAGYELYYQGIAGDGLQNGFAAFSLPIRRLGSFGLTSEYFTSNIYKQGNFGFNYSQTLLDQKISLGMKIGLINLSYNRSNFQLVDPDDPVFSQQTSKNTFDLSGSMLINPITPIFIGVAVHHLNNPNVSLIGEQVTIPTRILAGVMFSHPFIAPMINVDYSDDKIDIDVGLERWFFERHAMLRINYNRYHFGVNAATVIDLSRYWLRLDYEYKYPLSDLNEISNGFHQFMVSFARDIAGKAEDNKKISRIVVEEKKRPQLFGDISASVDKLVIKKTTRVRSHNPLLPYIFFNKNQSNLEPGRYRILNPERNPVKKFIFFPEKLQHRSSQYKNMLNIIAKRLWDNPHKKITVLGFNSGWGQEKGNLKLSRRRAESVRNYLLRNCGVRPEQVIVEAHQMPHDPASNNDPRGREENRRAEISCQPGSESILDPIVTETTEISTSDSSCIFQIKNVLAESGLRRWKLVIIQMPNDSFKVFHGQGNHSNNLIWDWKNDAGQSVEAGEDYRYRLTLWDNSGQTFATDWKTITVQKTSAKYIEEQVEKKSLILFKYDRAEMELSSKYQQQDLINIVQKIQHNPNISLLIHGHTDIIGQRDYNMKLSQRRAKTVVNYFIDQSVSQDRISHNGFGPTQPLMDNNLPEGRMINRRVEIYIVQ